jgi:hypothetical protein
MSETRRRDAKAVHRVHCEILRTGRLRRRVFGRPSHKTALPPARRGWPNESPSAPAANRAAQGISLAPATISASARARLRASQSLTQRITLASSQSAASAQFLGSRTINASASARPARKGGGALLEPSSSYPHSDLTPADAPCSLAR